MTILQKATRAFESVNVAGRLNDTLIDPVTLVRGAVQSEIQVNRNRVVRQRAAARAPAEQTLAKRLQDAGTVTAETATSMKNIVLHIFSLNLAVKRSIPLFWQPQLAAPSYAHMIGRLPLLRQVPIARAWTLTPTWPLAELIVGRGHKTDTTPPTMLGGFINGIGHWQNRASRHGLLGLALESSFVKLSNKASARGHNNLAAACMVAAVIGRLVLQPFRLAIIGAAIVFESHSTALTLLIFVALEIACRGLLGATLAYAKLTGHRPDTLIGPLFALLAGASDWRTFINRVAAQAVNPDELELMEVDDGSDGIHDRVRNRAINLMNRFAAVPAGVEGETATQAEARESAWAAETALKIADDLRHYCSGLPDNTALRGGLYQLKAFMDNTYEDVAFNPPELDAPELIAPAEA